MASIRLLWKLINKYLYYIVCNVSYNILSAALSVFSLLMLIPFLRVLFYPENKILTETHLPPIPFMGNLYDFWIQILESQGRKTALLALCICLLILFILKNGTRYLAAYFLIPVRTGVMQDLRADIYQKLLTLDFSFFQKKRRGEILTIFGNDVQEVEYGIVNFIETGIKEPVTMLVTLISLIIISPYLTLWVLVLLPISALVIGKIGKKLKKDSIEIQNQQTLLQTRVDEVMHGIRIIQSFGHTSTLLDRFGHENDVYRILHKNLLERKELASPLSEVLGIGVVSAILLIGGNAILNGTSTLSPEVFITYIVVFSQIISPAKAFSNAWYFIQKGAVSLHRIRSLIREKSFNGHKSGTSKVDDLNHQIEVKNLSFAFGEKEVLKDISLTIPKGHKIALVGPSGSGKTTLINLLSRVYEVPEKKVFWDQIDINEIALENFRNQFALVTQDPILFYGTVRDNLLLAKPDASYTQLQEALKLADAWNFVSQLPLQLDTLVSERGQSLSVGQQQRLALARAYLKGAPILILDEPTASLDSISSRAIQDSILHACTDKTILTIAHKLAAIAHYDQIIYLQSGSILAQGTHAELMQKCDSYRQMVLAQQLEKR